MERQAIYQETTRHFLAPVSDLLADPDVSEIMINGPECVYFEKGGRVQLSTATFQESQLAAAATNIAEFVGRRLDQDTHSMDARLPDGSRVHVIIPPASRCGVCITIRKFKPAGFDLDDLVRWGSMTEEARDFLALAVRMHKTTIVAGGTGTGKTSLLNALSTQIPDHERIVVIEDSSELQLRQPHTLYLEAQGKRPDGTGGVTIRDLFVDSLRMRPDRIVVGEVRRGEALDLIQSMISGHSGSMATVHATTARDAATRLETLCLMSDVAMPMSVARVQVASGLQLVVQLARYSDGSRRVRAISECLGLGDDGNYRFADLLVFEAQGYDANGKLRGQLKPTGIQPSFSSEVAAMGMESHVGKAAALIGGIADRAA